MSDVHTNEECRGRQDAWSVGDTGGLLVHQYRRCGFSGVGNCCCGRQPESTLHPHKFRQSLAASRTKGWWCVCSKLADHPIHEEAGQ